MPKAGTSFPTRITREVSYVETVDAEIIAASKEEAENIAVAIGNGEAVGWPSLRRYNVWEREPVEMTYINSENGRA